MNPGQRVNTIRRIVVLLSSYGFGDADLVLRQFGFPWSESWNGDEQSYIRAMVESESDEALLGLLSYLEAPDEGRPPDIPTSPWRAGFYRLFLGHIHGEKHFAAEAKTELAEWGVDGFVAHADIDPSREWVEVIERALGSCDALAAFLHPGFRESAWTDQEVGYVIQRGVLIIPVAFDASPHGFMGRYQAVPGAGKTPKQVADSIIAVLNDRDNAKLAGGLMARLEVATMYVDAIRLLESMEKRVQRWTPGLLGRLIEAPKLNRNVADSWRANEIIARIRKTHAPPEEEVPF